MLETIGTGLQQQDQRSQQGWKIPTNLYPAWAVALLPPLSPNSWEGYATKGTNRHVMPPFLANDTGDRNAEVGGMLGAGVHCQIRAISMTVE